MRRNILLVLAFCFAVSACQQTISETKNQTVKTSPTVSVSPINSSIPVSTPDATKIKIAKGKGIVTKINLELGSVEIDHEEIKDVMAAMKMEFYVKEKSELEVLKVGDKVDFVLEENFGQERLVSIKKAK